MAPKEGGAPSTSAGSGSKARQGGRHQPRDLSIALASGSSAGSRDYSCLPPPLAMHIKTPPVRRSPRSPRGSDVECAPLPPSPSHFARLGATIIPVSRCTSDAFYFIGCLWHTLILPLSPLLTRRQSYWSRSGSSSPRLSTSDIGAWRECV